MQCYVPSMYFHYNRGFAFLPPVRRDYGEGTYPPCISKILDKQSKSVEQCKSDKQCKSPHFHITYRLYI
eukprot:11038711-Ditylum_brightwellii.AAC.1